MEPTHSSFFYRLLGYLLIVVVGAQVVSAQEGAGSKYDISKLSKSEALARAGSLNREYLSARRTRIKSPPSTTILLHIKGNTGIKFERYEIDQETVDRTKKLVTELATSEYQKYLSDFTKELKSKVLIPLCEEDKLKLLMPLKKLDKSKLPSLKSVLMYQKELKPQDEKLAFGLDTYLMPFATEIPDGIPDFLKMTGFDCLPARMHVTKKGLVMVMGPSALRNYDISEDGVLDRSVERLWEDLKSFYRSKGRSEIGNKLMSIK